MAEVSLLLQLAGVAIEICGVLLMANGLAGISRPSGLPMLLWRTLWAKPTMEARLSRALDQEDRATALRGLALLVVGFLLQGAGLLIALAT